MKRRKKNSTPDKSDASKRVDESDAPADEASLRKTNLLVKKCKAPFYGKLPGMRTLSYATISRRFFALMIDGLIISIPCAIAGRLIPVVGGIIIPILYSPLLESSAARATLGKHLMGIQVVRLNGERISFGAGLLRYFMKLVSAMICFLGYVMALFTERRQTLHDWVAETIVIEGQYRGNLFDAWLDQVKSVFFNVKSVGQEFLSSTESGDLDSNKYEALERLQALRERGALTESEFQIEKQKILDRYNK
jgi:uncharacterized RDD family membrane protein YckC